jgi:lysophospholipase L1-like esterase
LAQQPNHVILAKASAILRHSACTSNNMRRRSPILRIGSGLLATALLTGCGKLGLDSGKSPVSPSGPPGAGSVIAYAAVGASDADGYGSSVPCPPWTDCPNGTGYAQVATRQLKAQGFEVTLTNLGIPTAVIGPDFEALGQQYNRTIVGNLIEREMPFVTNATLVTIFAGGNEINTITAALGAGAGGGDPAGYVDSQIRAFGADFTTLVDGIRARAKSARIVVLNVPNLAGLPFLATASLPQRQAAQRAAVGMTQTVVNRLTSQGVAVVDLMCDARTYSPSNCSADGFHPNDSGYAFIAAEIVRAVTSSSYPAPAASCSQMTVVP